MKKKIIILTFLFVISCSLFIIYINDYYKADYNAIDKFFTNKKVEVGRENNIITYHSNSDVGFIFYPGGKVDPNAYKPLLYLISKKNINTFLVDMPFNLAVFDINAADKIIKNNKHIKKWYIGGHSLGGAMAASYVKDNLNTIDGLILLGAYSSVNLSNSKLKVLSIYGSNDKILNKEKYNQYKKNLPKDYSEKVIIGGCHSYFGMYGLQDGDGKCSITNKEQIILTVNYITSYLINK